MKLGGKLVCFFDVDATLHFGLHEKHDYTNIKNSINSTNAITVLITSRLKNLFDSLPVLCEAIQPRYICTGDGKIVFCNKNTEEILKTADDITKPLYKNYYKNIFEHKELKLQPMEKQTNHRMALETDNWNDEIKLFLKKKIKNFPNLRLAISWEVPIENKRFRYIDIYSSNGGKNFQVQVIKKHLNLNDQRSIYFGDNGSDLVCSDQVNNFFFVSNDKILIEDNEIITKNIKIIKQRNFSLIANLIKNS